MELVLTPIKVPEACPLKVLEPMIKRAVEEVGSGEPLKTNPPVPVALVNLKAVRVAETERRSSAVRAPYILAMVAEVDRKLLDIS